MMTTEELVELKKLAQTNQYMVHGNPKTADCILTFSFGYIRTGEKILPGKSNAQIAEFIEGKLPNIPLIAQFEIADALRTRTAELVISKHRTPGKYLDSGEVAGQAFVYMKTKGWESAIIVTHPALVARNDYACTAIGIETIAPSGLERIEYDSASAQEWTRDAASWWGREEAVIDLCFQNGWIAKPKGFNDTRK